MCDRWYVRFDPPVSIEAAALYEGRRFVVPATVSEVTSVFTWRGAPRRSRTFRPSKKEAHQHELSGPIHVRRLSQPRWGLDKGNATPPAYRCVTQTRTGALPRHGCGLFIRSGV